jgi:hypothetical protein
VDDYKYSLKAKSKGAKEQKSKRENTKRRRKRRQLIFCFKSFEEKLSRSMASKNISQQNRENFVVKKIKFVTP